jgi:transposase InsO family protein
LHLWHHRYTSIARHGHSGQANCTSPPWQNGFAERLIGSIRRECLDHIVVFGEAHLRRILRSYARYYNDIRTHRSLDKDAPVFRPVQRAGSIKSFPILGGLHHHYARV